ncbi:F-box and wd40 domain protein, partial [Reticulomyxa filosa]
MLDTFRLSSKLLKTFIGHTDCVHNIDYLLFDNQLICSGSYDKTVRVWNVETNQQIQLYNGHSDYVYCVKFSQYYYHNNHHNQQLNIFNGHKYGICSIEFSSFNNGRYLCSGSRDNTVQLWDVETSKSLHVFNGHTNY